MVVVVQHVDIGMRLPPFVGARIAHNQATPRVVFKHKKLGISVFAGIRVSRKGTTASGEPGTPTAAAAGSGGAAAGAWPWGRGCDL